MVDLAKGIARAHNLFDCPDEIIDIDAVWDIYGGFRSLAKLSGGITAGTIGSISGQHQIHITDTPANGLGGSIDVGVISC